VIKLNRAERRRNERENANNKPKSNNWITKPSPKQLKQGSGWFGELDRAYVDINSEYAVMVRTISTKWGTVDHACIRNTKSTDIPWREKQRIKNELFGQDRTAIEVFPAEIDLVDEANMYHLWVFEKGVKLPFGL